MQSMGFSLLGQQSKAEEGRWSIKWREQVAAAMISVFVSPLNSYIGHLRFKVLAGGAFGRSLGHEGCHDLIRLISLLKKKREKEL